MQRTVARKTQQRAGMGAIIHDQGVAFRVWAPHADAVSVVGSFNDWRPHVNAMVRDESGYWYCDVSSAKVGDEYRFHLTNAEREFTRIDPYAREVTNSVGNAIIHDPQFDWGDDASPLPPTNELVIYELHVGTFNGDPENLPGSFSNVSSKFDHLRKLGVNAIEIMPAAEFAGDISWGYNPAHIFAVESSYGGPQALKKFVKEAHRHGLAVIMDVVYNHFGPSDLDLWQFDGWSEQNLGGIYFYNDWRAETPWGASRPDYGRGEVRQFIRDNALMWLDEYHMDGLRYDMTLFIRNVKPGQDLPDGWSLTQWVNREVQERFPGRITIAEDLQNNEFLTRSIDEGGAGFTMQWDARFVHPIRSAVTLPEDIDRSMASVRDAILARYNGDAFQRVIYSESHDEVANGKQRVPSEVSPHDNQGWYAQKRSTLAAALVFTSPGVPMLFQGQEFLQGGWFRDDVPLDWDLCEEYHGIVRLYRDLIALRLNRHGGSRGLCGQGAAVYHHNEHDKMLAFHRWDRGGPGDDVLVIVNFSNQHLTDYRVGAPRAGEWRLRLNSDANIYSDDFGNCGSGHASTNQPGYDGHPFSIAVTVAPYSVLIYSQDPVPDDAAEQRSNGTDS